MPQRAGGTRCGWCKSAGCSTLLPFGIVLTWRTLVLRQRWQNPRKVDAHKGCFVCCKCPLCSSMHTHVPTLNFQLMYSRANTHSCTDTHTLPHMHTPLQSTSKQKVQCKPLKSPMPPACILYCILFCAVAERKRKLQENGKMAGVANIGWWAKWRNAVENIVQRARSEVDNDNRANNEAFLMWPLNNGNEDNAHTQTHIHNQAKKRERNTLTAVDGESNSLPNKLNLKKIFQTFKT